MIDYTHLNGFFKNFNVFNLKLEQLECCGVSFYTDWANATGAPEVSFVPQSCCRQGAYDKCTDTITRQNLNDTVAAEKLIYIEVCYYVNIIMSYLLLID